MVRLPRVRPVIDDRLRVPPDMIMSEPLPEMNETIFPLLSLKLNAPFAISYK
jgi:hypothetical protein